MLVGYYWRFLAYIYYTVRIIVAEMYFEDEKVPPLIPIKGSKKTNQKAQEKASISGEELMQLFAKQFDKNYPQQQDVKPTK